MRIINPGGSGGSGTVQTDGVTIQGDGSAGNKIALLDAITDNVTLQGAGISSSKLAIKAVQTDATLTGAGTVASPLKVKPNTFFALGSGQGGGVSVSTNTLTLCGFSLEGALTFSNISVNIFSGDASFDVDLGLYNAAGTLLANIGAQVINVTGIQVFPTVQGAQTIPPGRYLFAQTSNHNSFELFGSTVAFWSWFAATGFGSSSGGALPASIAAPTLSPSSNVWNAVAFFY